MRIRIEKLNEPGMEIFTQFSENQLQHIYEPDLGLFIAESPLVIERALRDGYEPVAILLDEAELKGPTLEIVEQIEGSKEMTASPARNESADPEVKVISDGGSIPIYMASSEVLKALPGFTLTRGLLCAMRRRTSLDLEKVLEESRNIAILEDVVNPTNLGAIFRSAAALHIDAVILTANCTDPLYRRSARVSMGTVFQVPWTWFPTEKIDFELLKQKGYTTVAMALRHDSVTIDDPVLKKLKKKAIIMGSEGPGLTDETLRTAEYVAKIPMSGGVDSLNVAAASAVAFWELTK